jgi:hypothetical protein
MISFELIGIWLLWILSIGKVANMRARRLRSDRYSEPNIHKDIIIQAYIRISALIVLIVTVLHTS